MQKIFLLICTLLCFGNLQANPDYLLNILLQKTNDGRIEYTIAGSRTLALVLDIKNATKEQITEVVKKTLKLIPDSSIHVIVDEQCTMRDLYKLCRIIRDAGAKNITVTSTVNVPNLKEIESVEINHLKIITVDPAAAYPFDTPVELPADTLKK